MKQDNTILYLLIGGGLLWWWLSKNKTTPAQAAASSASVPGSVVLSLPETTGVAQLTPTPASIMDIPGISARPESGGPCGCNCNKISGIDKNNFVI